MHSTVFNPQFICSVLLSHCSLLHFFPTLQFPSPSCQLFLTHSLSALFSWHSAPYITSSLTLHFLSPFNQLFYTHFICSVPLSQCTKFHSFPYTTLPSQSSQLFVTKYISSMFNCHSANNFISSLTILLPSPSIQLFVTHNLFAMFHCHSAPYFIFPIQYTFLLHPVSCLFKTHNLLCSFVTVLFF
jgi:hypothetical protein